MLKKSIRLIMSVVLLISIFITVPVYVSATSSPKYILDAQALPDGTIAVLYRQDGIISLGNFDPQSEMWAKVSIAEGKDGALALGPLQELHIAYITSSDEIGYTYLDGNSFVTTQIISSLDFGGVEGVLTYPDLEIDSSGKAWITYFDSKGGHDPGQDYSAYDKDDLMVASNVSGSFVVSVRAYSHGWFYSPDGWRNLMIAPPKIALINDAYRIGAKSYNYDKWMSGQYHTYSYSVFAPPADPTNDIGYTIRSASTNNDLGFRLYEVASFGTSVYSLIRQSGVISILSGVTTVEGSQQTFSGDAADLTLSSGGQLFTAALTTNQLMLYQNGFIKSAMSVTDAIDSTHQRLTTVVANDVQYVFYTDGSGKMWVVENGLEQDDLTIKKTEIPDKVQVTIGGLSVSNKTYDGEAVSVSGVADITRDDTGQTVSISNLVYIWTEKLSGDIWPEAPSKAGDYRLIVSVDPDDPAYIGSTSIDFKISEKQLTIEGLSAVDRTYNASTTVDLVNGLLSGLIDSDDVLVNIPLTGTISSANVGIDKLVLIDTLVLSGLDKDNYTLIQPIGIMVDIFKAQLSLESVVVLDKVYDGDRDATVLSYTFSGLQGDETMEASDVTFVAMFDDANASELAINVDVSVTLISNELTDNYQLDVDAVSTSALITKAEGLSADYLFDLEMIHNLIADYSFDLRSIVLSHADTGPLSFVLSNLTNEEIFTILPSIAMDGVTMNYRSASHDAGSSSITVTIRSQNYHDATIDLSFVLIDVTPPVVIGVENNQYYNTNRTITYNEGTAMLNGEDFTSGTEVTEEGIYVLVVMDRAGNTTTVNFVIDKTAPEITVGSYSTLPTNQDVTVTVSTDEGTLNATSHTFTENGSFVFIATDLAGNVTQETVTISHIDKIAPEVSGVENNQYSNTNLTIIFNEGVATLNNVVFISDTEVTEEGSYVLIVMDAAGNTTTISFVIDKTAPIITITPYSTEYTHLPVTVSVTTDEGTLNTTSHTFNENGSFTFIATDMAGNVTEKIVTISHIVSSTQVKTIEISQLPAKLNYIQGVDLDPTGGLLTVATYEGILSSVALTLDMFSVYDPFTSNFGPQTVTVIYQGVTTTFEVYLNRFIDVPYGHRNYTHINALVGLGIINGYSDNTFRPNNTLTRAQAAIMIVRAAGISTEGVSSNFADVPPTHAAYKFISAAYQAGIINGYSDGTFRPNANVTRAQIAIMVQRAFNVQASGIVVSFTDVPEGYAPKKFIEILASQKIVNGYSDGTFRPIDNVTRAQFSTMIYNAIQYVQRSK
jgi:hypothetical protein